jgi:hypothetical protein
MMSADPTVPDPLNAQTWNRYSYVGNDLLTFRFRSEAAGARSNRRDNPMTFTTAC